MKRQAESITRSLVHRKIDDLIPEIMEYAEQTYPENILHEAWGDFYGQDTGFEENPYADMFIKWFLFLWTPEEADEQEGESIYPSPHTVGATFLKANKNKMDSLSVRILKATLNDPLSFWQVEAVKAQRGALLKDLLLGRERFVEDITDSQHLTKWDILLANMQTLDGIHVFNITGPYALPPNAKASLQEAFPMDTNAPDAIWQLFEYDLDLLMFYQDVIDELFAASYSGFLSRCYSHPDFGCELIFQEKASVVGGIGRSCTVC